MAKKRQKKEEKKLEDSKEEEDELGIKKWIFKTISMVVFLIILVLMTEWMFDVQIISEALIAIAVVVPLGFIHEGLHYREAIKLGYKVKWYRTKLTMGFDIISTDKKTWNTHKKQIGYAPYKFIIPIAIAITFVGWLLNSLGVTAAGVASIVLHIYSYSREGRDIE